MQNLPLFISIVLVLTTIITVIFFLLATNRPKITLIVILGWLLLHSIIALTGFYTITNTIPPRFALLLAPPTLFIVTLFFIPAGKRYIDNLDTKTLTILHSIRIPVEFMILWLAMYKTLPQLMTFEGRNFDIFSGLSAPFIFYFGFVKKKLNSKVLLAWNFICLGLLINIVALAILSAPFPFQKFAFEQPNIAVLYFPFIWLPCCVVPLVLFAHLATIRQLLQQQKTI